MAGAAAADVGRLEAAHAAHLEGANGRLREELREALQELDAAHAQLRILQSLQRQLEDATPGAAELAAVALEQERALQAARDAQLLQMLRAKDEVIESFELRYAEARAEMAQLREQRADAERQLEASQLRVQELVDSKRTLQGDIEQQAAARADAEAALQAKAAQCDQMSQQIQRLEQDAKAARTDFSSAQQQLQTLSATIDAANNAIEEAHGMLTAQEQQLAQKDAEAAMLQQHLSQLLGVPQSDASMLHNARFKAQPEPASHLAALEAANERLELALVQATQQLSAQQAAVDAELASKLRAAQERAEQLEKALKVAEATVLHSEVQLQESLEERFLAEEKLHQLELELHDERASLTQLAAAEQAARREAAEARSALQANCDSVRMALEQLAQTCPSLAPQAAALTAASGATVGGLAGVLASAHAELARQHQQALHALHTAALEVKSVATQCEAEAPAAAPEVVSSATQCELITQASVAVQTVHAAAAQGGQADAVPAVASAPADQGQHRQQEWQPREQQQRQVELPQLLQQHGQPQELSPRSPSQAASPAVEVAGKAGASVQQLEAECKLPQEPKKQTACELDELRNAAFAAVHAIRQALAMPGVSTAHDCSDGAAPKQLTAAVSAALAVIEHHRVQQQQHVQQQYVQQQHVQQQQPQVPVCPSAGTVHDDLPADAAQRAVIRSLAAQVAELEQARSAVTTRQLPPTSTPTDTAKLRGMVVLLKNQLSNLQCIQQQLNASATSGAIGDAGSSSSSSSSSSSNSMVYQHCAAMLGTELPAMQATVAVLEAELQQQWAAQVAEAPGSSSGGQGTSTGSQPLDASASDASAATLQSKHKWKARCKELRAQLASASAAVHQAESAAAAQAAEHAGTVQHLQARVEQLAAAGAQLEYELGEAAAASEALQLQLQLQQQAHVAALQEAEQEVSAAQAALEQEQQHHSALLASLQHDLRSSDGVEDRLGSQLAALTERVACQEAAAAEAEQLLAGKQQQLEAERAACRELAAKQRQGEAEQARRVEELQQTCAELLAAVERAEGQHAEVEQRLRARLGLLAAQLEQQDSEQAAYLPAIDAGLARLLQSGEALEVRLLRLEAQAAVAAQDCQAAAVQKWATLLRSQRYHVAVEQLRCSLQAQLLDAQAVCQQQAAQLVHMQEALECCMADRAALGSRLQEAQQELQQAIDGQQQLQCQLADLQQQAGQERQELLQQAREAAVEAERQMAARERQQCKLDECQHQCSSLQAQLDTAHRAFQQHQASKAAELAQREQQLACVEQAVQQLSARATGAEQALAAAQSQQADECRLARAHAERLAVELADCQQALQLAKTEGSQRLKELQALEHQAAMKENSSANSATMAAQLRDARQALASKAARIEGLLSKVRELEGELRARDPAPLQQELEACRAKLRRSQAACASREAAMKQLQERLEQQARLAHQEGIAEERERQEAARKRLTRQLEERDGQVARLHQQLQQVHHELEEASVRLHAAAASQSMQADGTAAELAASRHCAQQLLQAIRLALEALVQLASAMAAGRAGQDGAQEDAAITSAACLVGLAPDDIRSVLSAPAASSLEAAAQHAWAALQQAELEQQHTVQGLVLALGELAEQACSYC